MIKLVKSTFLEEAETKEKLIEFIRDAKQLSFGPECERFERDFAAWQGRKYVVLMNSGSSANLALVQALLNLGRLKKGDMVGFSELTWATNVMPLLQLGLVPVPIDIELETLNISSKKFCERLTQFPLKGLFLTNILGFCGDVDEIVKICAERGIVLFEDNCESLGTVYKGKKLGNHGVAASFSFFVGHHLSTIEGGAVCTDDVELAVMLRMVRAHGWDRNLKSDEQDAIRAAYHVSPFYGKYSFYDLGYNFRPTEIAGFLGNAQLPYADHIVSERAKNFHALAEAIYKNKNYYPLDVRHVELVSNFAFPIVCRSAAARNALLERAKDVVEVRPILGGDIVAQPFFAKYAPEEVRGLKNPNANLVHEGGLYCANNPELSAEDVKTIINVFA